MDYIITPLKKLCLLNCILLIFGWIGYGFWTDITLYPNHTREGSRLHQHNMYPVLADATRYLHIFVQVSDLHLSIYHDKRRGPDFEDFCRETIPVIRPEAVFVTGDLTDAKYPDKQGSMQIEEEWRMYDRILKESKVLDNTVWLDIRGNHDAFDVPSLKSNLNYFKKYSHQGKNHSQGYAYNHHTGESRENITFFGFDACPDPGPRRPFNFFGLLLDRELDEIETMANQHIPSSNVTIWFGHYPTSLITGDIPRLRNILSGGSVYLTGHLHTLGDLVHHMYSRHQTGLLELELGDWMDNRLFRVFALDHGEFSFIDQRHNTWPVIMVTNPRHAQFVMPGKDSNKAALKSTHIRIVAFSPSIISSVAVEIDGKPIGVARPSGKSLYTVPWHPQRYSTGLHTLTITVQDSIGRRKIQEQPFSLDGTEVQFDFIRRFIIMSQHHMEAKTLFVIAFIGTVLPMIFMKVINISVEVDGSSKNKLCSCMMMYLCQIVLRRYKLLANTPFIYWPLLLFHIYVAIGPWFIGEVIQGYIGLLFVFGVYVNGAFIPGSLTFLYGFFQMLLFNFPLTIYLMHVLDHQLCGDKKSAQPSRLPKLLSWILHHGGFCLMLFYQLYLSYSGFYKAYGLIAALLCPVRTWSVPYALMLRWMAMGLRGQGRSQKIIEKVSVEGHE